MKNEEYEEPDASRSCESEELLARYNAPESGPPWTGIDLRFPDGESLRVRPDDPEDMAEFLALLEWAWRFRDRVGPHVDIEIVPHRGERGIRPFMRRR